MSANLLKEIETAVIDSHIVAYCSNCGTPFTYISEMLDHDPIKCYNREQSKEVNNMTNLSEALMQATARVSTDTELLQQITSVVAMNVPDETKILLLNGIGQKISPKPTERPITVTPPTKKPKAVAQDDSIRVYLKEDTGNLILKGAIGVGRSFATISVNRKSPHLSKQVVTSNSLPMQVEYSQNARLIRVSYEIDKLSDGEIVAIQKFLANLEKPQETSTTAKTTKTKGKIPNTQATVIPDQATQMQIFSEASTLMSNGLAKDMEEALAKAKEARGIK